MLFLLLFSLNLYAQDNCYQQESLPFIEWVKSFRYHEKCSPLKVGEGRVFRGSRGTESEEYKDPITGKKSTFKRPNDTNYLLRRHSEKDFEIIFNTRFIPTTVSQQTTTSDQIKQMEARVKNCFEAASEHMKGPQGERIRIRAITTDKEEGALRPNFPPKININVLPQSTRGNAENFGSDFGCPAIVHEYLHHAGLCDEYHEAPTGSSEHQASGSCRAVMPSNSIMSSDMWGVYDSAVGEQGACEIPSTHPLASWFPKQNQETLKNYFRKTWNHIGRNENKSYDQQEKYCKRVYASRSASDPFIAVKVQDLSANKLHLLSDSFTSAGTITRTDMKCECGSTDQECLRFLESAKEDARLYSDPKKNFYQCPSGNLVGMNGELAKGDLRINPASPLRIEMHSHGRGGSLLHPNHFVKLMNGDCRSAQTEAYDQCAVWAYSHSQPSTNCAEVPPHCRTPEGYLGSRERIK